MDGDVVYRFLNTGLQALLVALAFMVGYFYGRGRRGP